MGEDITEELSAITYITSTSPTNISNFTSNTFIKEEELTLILANLYKYWVPPLIIFCLVSLVINIKVLMAIHWLRRPISPTVNISLSLAAADAISSLFLGVHLLVNSYIREVHAIELPCYLTAYTVEIYRLSGIIITVLHLLTLSINHWLGILKPMHYTSIMTTKKTSIIIFFLWILPIVFFNSYFYGHRSKNIECDVAFIFRFKFRIVFSFLFFIPLIFMVFFYTHILLMVKAQRERWAALERSGSKRNKTLTRSNNQQRRTMENNIKAITTTLLILGSCLIGWMPSVTKFMLVCVEGCKYSYEDGLKIGIIPNFIISYMSYFLLILKTMANPIIYSTRMTEVKEATRKMNQAICGAFCKRDANNRQDNVFESQTLQLGISGSTRATLYRLNGSIGHRSIRRKQSNNTVV
ncbi:7 transmembrane receptor (rhodopsin family) [Popillia japonica]|uniref:7 transmembrane receptor (Rhodopsin family) n=1 Tax=Popillia japonica TaxID=7064 RepID=A0AAW1LFK3_POPJA